MPVVVDNQNNTYSKAVRGVPAQINTHNVWHYAKIRYGPLEKFNKWYKKETKLHQHDETRRHKKLKAKDKYLYVGQLVYINLTSVQLLRDSRDSTVKRSKTG